MPSASLSAPRAVLLWLLTCICVFLVLDAVATRRVPIRVEHFRQTGMNDEQVLADAVQAAYRVESNLWWIHDKRPFLVFDAHREYRIAESTYAAFDLEVTTDAEQNRIALLNAIATP